MRLAASRAGLSHSRASNFSGFSAKNLRTAAVMARRMSVSMLILRTPNLIASWISLDRHAVGFLHLAAVLADLLEQVLRHAGAAVHHQVGVGDATVDLLDAVDGQDVAWACG
jgi:hypothetical protein